MMGETAADRQAFPWMAGAEQVKLPLTIPEVPKWNIKGSFFHLLLGSEGVFF